MIESTRRSSSAGVSALPRMRTRSPPVRKIGGSPTRRCRSELPDLTNDLSSSPSRCSAAWYCESANSPGSAPAAPAAGGASGDSTMAPAGSAGGGGGGGGGAWAPRTGAAPDASRGQGGPPSPPRQRGGGRARRGVPRSEERRVGKEGRFRGGPY